MDKHTLKILQCSCFSEIFSAKRKTHSFSMSAKTFGKTKISHPLIRTRMCVYQEVRNACFSENFANVLNKWSFSALKTQSKCAAMSMMTLQISTLVDISKTQKSKRHVTHRRGEIHLGVNFLEKHVPFTSGWKLKIFTPVWNEYFDLSVYFKCFHFIKIQIFC